MLLIRIILQIVIVIIGGLAVAVFLGSREFIGAIFFMGFTAVLLAFTNILKEQTEKHLSGASLHEQNHTAVRAVLSLLGGFGMDYPQFRRHLALFAPDLFKRFRAHAI